MPCKIYGGVKYYQIRHALYCKKCKDILESKHLHDFKFCSCNSIGIDGGIEEGNSILGNKNDMEDRSIYCAYINNVKLYLPVNPD